MRPRQFWLASLAAAAALLAPAPARDAPDSTLPSMSATFYAAGPNIRTGLVLSTMRNIDIAPTVLQILGVSGAGTVDGNALTPILQ